MTTKDLRAIIARGEGQSVELKAAVPPPRRLARLLASFANANGGYVIFGVREPAVVVGVDERHTRWIIDHARQSLGGKVDLSLEFVPLDGKQIAVVSVSRAPGLVAADGAYYLRVGESTQPLSAHQIKEHVTRGQSADAALSALSDAVATSTATVERLQHEFEKANSPGRRLVWIIVGAIAGAIIKGAAEHAW